MSERSSIEFIKELGRGSPPVPSVSAVTTRFDDALRAIAQRVVAEASVTTLDAIADGIDESGDYDQLVCLVKEAASDFLEHGRLGTRHQRVRALRIAFSELVRIHSSSEVTE